MKIALLIDLGSTYTKVRAVDLEREELLSSSQAKSTVDTDVTIGLKKALDRLSMRLNIDEHDFYKKLACSSAAGGLKIIAIGLVPSLTTEAAKRAYSKYWC